MRHRVGTWGSSSYLCLYTVRPLHVMSVRCSSALLSRLQTPLSTRCERVADALAWYHTSHRFGLLSRLWLAVRFTNMANERRKRWKGAQVQSCLATIQRSTAIFIPPFISATHLLRSLGQDFFVPSSMQPRLPPAQAASCSLERHLAQTR